MSTTPLIALPILSVYHAKWWSSVDWAWNEAELLAADEAQVRAWVDTQTLPQYRRKRTSDQPRDTPEAQWPDRLVISVVKCVEQLPLVLRGGGW